nr:hypothetical protein [Lentilactobacillus senioris]
MKGAEALNLQPEQCIGIEDAAAGVEAINGGAGETSVGIGSAKLLHEADIIFPTTKDLTLANIQKAMG